MIGEFWMFGFEKRRLVVPNSQSEFSLRVATVQVVVTLLLGILPSEALLQHASAQQRPASGNQGKSDTPGRKMKVLGPFLSREDINEYTKVVLKNGLTVIVYERKDLPLVSIGTYVKTGYLYEPDEFRGISHVIEHAFFKRTAKRGVGRIAKETKILGGYLNARTFYDYTFYYTVLPAENFRQGLEIQADALQNPALPDEELKREVQVILQEGRRKLDNAQAFSLEKLYELAFEVNPVRRWRIGDASTLVPLTRQNVKDFYGRWYDPANMVLIIAGNVDRRLALEEAVKRYAGMEQRQKLDAATPAEPEQRAFKYRELRGDISESIIQIGFQAPPAFSNSWYACKVLEAILTQGSNSVLNRRLKEDKELINSVSSTYLDLRDLGYFTITLGLEARNINQAEVSTFAELERIKDGSLTEIDVERAKKLLELDIYLERERLNDLAFQLGRYEHLANPIEWKSQVRKIQAVTREQVIRVCKRHFSLPHCSLLEYQPLSALPRNFTPDSYQQFLKQALPLAVEEAREGGRLEELYGSSLKGRPPPSRRTVPSEISSASVVYPLKKYSILRGPDVLVKEGRALPLVSLGIFFAGGRAFESIRQNGITELMVRSSVKGAGRLTAPQLAAIFENQGSRIELKVEPDFFGYVVTGLSESFEVCAETLAEIVKEPRFDEDQVKREKTVLLAEAARLNDSTLLYPQQLFFQAVYGDHPYGLPPYGSAPSITTLTREDLIAWHKRFVQNSIPVVVVAGNTEGSSIASRLSTRFSSSDLSSLDWKASLPVKRLEANRERIEQRERNQTGTVLGFLGPGAREPDCYALTVLQSALSGPGGRFFDEFPDKQGLAYTVVVSQKRQVLGGTFYAYVATSPEYEQLALTGLKRQFERLLTDPLSEEEMKLGKNFSTGMYYVQLQQRAEQVFEFARSIIFGRSTEEITDYPKELQNVDHEIMGQVVRRYIHTSQLAVGMLKGSARSTE